MNNDDALISKLISETYLDTSDKDQPNAVSDLRSYFERKLNEVDFISVSDYINQHNLVAFKLWWQKQSHCYRLKHKGSVLDFPSNWSIFKEIQKENLVYVDQSLDQDFLLDIFAELTGTLSNIALVKENDEVKIVYLSEEKSREHIQWFRSFFEKQYHRPKTEEAA